MYNYSIEMCIGEYFKKVYICIFNRDKEEHQKINNIISYVLLYIL